MALCLLLCLMGLYKSICLFVGPDGFFMGPYRSLCVVMDSNGSLWVLINPHAPSLVLIGPCMS